MLRLKLKRYLRQRGLSEADLADAVADIVIERGKPVSERYLRYLTSNSELLTPDNQQRKPSLVMLGLLIRGLRRLTGEEVNLGDLVEYVSDPAEVDWLFVSPRARIAEEQTDLTAADEMSSNELVHIRHPVNDSDERLDKLQALIAQRLKARESPILAKAFNVTFAEYGGKVPNPPRHGSYGSWLFAAVGAFLIALLFVIAYENFSVQPRLLAARGGIFSFRDRVKATSDLPIPTLIGPEGEIGQLSPALRVSEVPGALGYEFFVKNLVSGDNVYTGPVSNNSFPIPDGTLCPNTPYEWRVRILGEDGWTSFSSALTFMVLANALNASQQHLIQLAQIREKPEPPTMLSPLGSASSTTPTLEVTPDPKVMGYGFYIRNLETDQVIYNNNFALTNRVKVPERLLREGGIYQWNVRSRNCHYWSEFTPAQVFNVDAVGE